MDSFDAHIINAHAGDVDHFLSVSRLGNGLKVFDQFVYRKPSH